MTFYYFINKTICYTVITSYSIHYTKLYDLTIRSAFYPILKEKIWGWPGHVIDLLAVLATIFGLATSLGLGAKQAASGLNYVFDIGNTINIQIGIIIFITAVAIFSVVIV